MGQGGGGVFAGNMDFMTYDDVTGSSWEKAKGREFARAEWALLDQIASESAGRVSMTFEVTSDNLVRQRLKKVEQLAAKHAQLLIRPQCHARPQGMVQAVNTRVNLLLLSKTFRDLSKQTGQDTAALMSRLHDPNVRSQIIAEADASYTEAETQAKTGEKGQFVGLVAALRLDRNFAWTSGYEPSLDNNLKAVAIRQGQRPIEVYYDVLVPADASVGVAWYPTNNLAIFEPDDHMRQVLEHPCIIPGVGDGGAHSGIFNDAQGPSHLLTHWARDRQNGKRLPIELLVRKQTRDVAELFGLKDRGLVRAGLRADLNIIDFEQLMMEKPFVVCDLPTGASRVTQHVSGYRLTLVNGCVTFEDGQATGALPGRLVRNPKADASKFQGVAASVACKVDKSKEATEEDLSDYALKAAQGGGLSATARVARAMEAEEGERSRL